MTLTWKPEITVLDGFRQDLAQHRDHHTQRSFHSNAQHCRQMYLTHLEIKRCIFIFITNVIYVRFESQNYGMASFLLNSIMSPVPDGILKIITYLIISLLAA